MWCQDHMTIQIIFPFRILCQKIQSICIQHNRFLFLFCFFKEKLHFISRLHRHSDSRADHQHVTPVKILFPVTGTRNHRLRKHRLKRDSIFLRRYDFYHSGPCCKSSRSTQKCCSAHATASGHCKNFSKGTLVSVCLFLRQFTQIRFFR